MIVVTDDIAGDCEWCGDEMTEEEYAYCPECGADMHDHCVDDHYAEEHEEEESMEDLT